jgi:DinB superfamily
MQQEASLRKHLFYVLKGGGAHVSLDDFVRDFPVDLCGNRVEGLPYTAWQVLEHMRIAQWDILEFTRDPSHVSPDFPSGYWPAPDQNGTPELWSETLEKFRHDQSEMQKLVADEKSDLHAKLPHGNGQTILREALLIADHNAYHLGALAVIMRLLTKQ